MATLKINDLSVGDWVRYEDNIYKLYAIEECGLLRGKWKSDEDVAHIAKHIDYFDPIPITAEILGKNGFVKKNYDNGKMWDWWCDNVLVRKYADEDIYRFIVALNSMHYTPTMVVGKHPINSSTA